MKYNKALQLFLAAGLSLLALTSCSKDDSSSSTKLKYTFELDVTDNTYTYQSGDTIGALLPSSSVLIPRLGFQSGKHFLGKAASISQKTSYAYVYPIDLLDFAHSDTVRVKVNTSAQDGLQDGLMQFRMGYNKIDTVIDYKASGELTMTDMLAHGKFSFTNQGQPIQKISRLEISSVSGSFHGYQLYNVRKKDWETADQNNLIMENPSGVDGTILLNLIPTTGAQLSFYIETTSGVRYTGKCDSSIEMKAGQTYEIHCDCQSFDRKAKVGDYFYSDGTYNSEYDRSKVLTGIVFALSDEMDGDINTSLKEGYHGRVVSITDLRGSGDLSRWAASSTYIYDITQIPNYEGVLDTDTLNYLKQLDGNTIAISDDGYIEKWPTKGALSSFKGLEYTAVCDTSESKYQAAYRAHNLSRAGFSNKRWYLPATGEMALLYQQYVKHIICAATKESFTDYNEKAYWTADEYGENKAWAVNFITGMVFCNYKMSYYQVRPCLHF